jgi:hypothetical protein
MQTELLKRQERITLQNGTVVRKNNPGFLAGFKKYLLMDSFYTEKGDCKSMAILRKIVLSQKRNKLY